MCIRCYIKNVIFITSYLIIKSTSQSPSFLCIGDNVCQNQTFQCTQYEECIIVCDGVESCKGTTIYCPPGAYPCTVLSTGSCASCDGTIDASQSFGGTLTVTGVGSGPHYPNIICPHGADCILSQSVGINAWSDSNIQSQWDTTKLDINVTGDNALTNTAIYCPNRHIIGYEDNCKVEIYNTGINKMNNLIIYARESWTDIQLLCNDASCGNNILMKCGENYEYECDALGNTQNINSCINTADTCNNYTLKWDRNCIDDNIHNCSTDPFICEPNKDCYIRCSADNGATYLCQNHNITCPDDYNCYINGYGNRVYYDIEVHGGNSGNLYFYMAWNYNMMQTSDIYCPIDGVCSFYTKGDQAFHEAAFLHARIWAQNSKLVNIYAGTNKGFTYLNLYCPLTHITGPEFNCNLFTDYGSQMTGSANIYAEEGFNDVMVGCKYVTDETECANFNMHCDVINNNEICVAQRISDSYTNISHIIRKWECDPAYPYCDTVTLTPTNIPTNIPTHEPTANPTKDPTKQPTNEPTLQPIDASIDVWRPIFKINRNVSLFEGAENPNNYYLSDNIFTFYDLIEEEEYISSITRYIEQTNFKSLLINEWKNNQINVSKIKISINTDGIENNFVIFDTITGGKWDTWLNPIYIHNSSWIDLLPNITTLSDNGYGITDHTLDQRRSFLIWLTSGGCTANSFWFAISIWNWCSEWNEGTNIPGIFYSPGNMIVNQYTSGAQADTFIVSILYDKPTPQPTDNPSESPSIEPTDKSGEVYTTDMFMNSDTLDIPQNETKHESAITDFFETVLLIIGLCWCLVIMISYIDAHYYRINNFYNPSRLITAGVHNMDMISDVFFTLQILFHTNFHTNKSLLIIFISSIIFIVIPITSTLFQLYHEINKHWMFIDQLRAWTTNHVKMLYIFSIMTGSAFAGVLLCSSNLFSLPIFSLPINKTRLLAFENKKVYSIVFVENVPQLFLQIFYIIAANKTFNTNITIVYTSMIFSVMSIIIAVITMIIQKQLLQSQNYVNIQFDVIGNSVSSQIKNCKNKVNKIKHNISGILGVDESFIEIPPPKQIPNGLQMNINIFVAISTAIDGKYEQIIKDSKQNGRLCDIIKESWKLNDTPNITNIDYKIIESKKRKHNTVEIKMKEMHTNTNMTSTVAETENENELNDNVAVNINMKSLPPVIDGNIGIITKGGNIGSSEYDNGEESQSSHNMQYMQTVGQTDGSYNINNMNDSMINNM